MFVHDADTVQREKEKALRGQCETAVPGHEGWHEAIASASEAIVKAERAPDLDMTQMQAKSVEFIKKKHLGDEAAPANQGNNVSEQPSMKEHLDKSRSDPACRGHGQQD